MKKRILGLLIAIGICIPTYASVAVSPTKVEINANKIRNNYVTTAVEIRGETERPVRFRASAGYFTISDQGEMILKESGNDPHDISKKVRFVPSEFTVPPGKTQKLRVNVANIASLPDGESRAVLFLEDIQPKEIDFSSPTGIGAQLVLKTRVGIPIYLDKGKFTKKAEIEYLNIIEEKDGLYTEMKILSTGNSKVRYNAVVQIIKNKKLIGEYNLEGKVVGSENSLVTKDKIETKKITEAGDYNLRMILSYYDQDGNRKNVKKDVMLQIKDEI